MTRRRVLSPSTRLGGGTVNALVRMRPTHSSVSFAAHTDDSAVVGLVGVTRWIESPVPSRQSELAARPVTPEARTLPEPVDAVAHSTIAHAGCRIAHQIRPVNASTMITLSRTVSNPDGP